MKYVFANCLLDLNLLELSVDGKPRKVEPQVFDILRHMVENPNRLITQQELIDTVWQGRVVSESTVSARLSAARSAIGDSGSAQSMIKTVPRRGFKFVLPVKLESDTGSTGLENSIKTGGLQTEPQTINQRVRFCHSRDGVRIAYATTGIGYPLVRVGHWLTHLEHDWHSPIWRPFLDELGKCFEVTRYDQRGNGLSDWEVERFDIDVFTNDLASVIDNSNLNQFALYATSQGVPVAIKYAVKHPDRISHLILHGGYVRGRACRKTPGEKEQGEALVTLMRHGWGDPGSPFLKAFSSMYIPDATSEQIDSLVELQRMTASPDNAVKIRIAADSFDVSNLLEKVNVPTLVIHARNDGIQPLSQGKNLASGIKNAEFVLLDSANHAVLHQEPAGAILQQEIRNFVLD